MNGSADLAFVNGDVYTVDAARSWAQAVAVRDGRITAVGTDAQIRDLVDTSTEVVDLRGRMLLPGFQDAHVHPVSSGLEMLRCDLNDLPSAEHYLGAIAAYARANPGEPWILEQAFPAVRATPLVTVLDGHPHTLSFLATVNRVPHTALGVAQFGQSGSIEDLYRCNGIDTDSIIRAALDLVS